MKILIKNLKFLNFSTYVILETPQIQIFWNSSRSSDR